DTFLPLGNGWNLPGLAQLIPDASGVLKTDGRGGAKYFTGPVSGNFTSPASDSGVLVRNVGGNYTYTDKYQDKEQFDSSGKMTGRVDPHGLTTSYLCRTEF